MENESILGRYVSTTYNMSDNAIAFRKYKVIDDIAGAPMICGELGDIVVSIGHVSTYAARARGYLFNQSRKECGKSNQICLLIRIQNENTCINYALAALSIRRFWEIAPYRI